MPPEKTPTPTDTGELKRLRTYEGDVAEVLAKKNITRTSIALAEEERKRREPPPPPTIPSAPKILRITPVPEPGHRFSIALNTINWPRVRVSIVIALLAALIGFSVYLIATRKPHGETTPAAAQPRQTADITFTGTETRAAFIARLRKGIEAARVPAGEVRELAIRSDNLPLSPPELATLLRADAPPPLIRALGTLTVGVHAAKNENRLFLLFEVQSFEHAFDGMLSWEKTLLPDVGPLLGTNQKDLAPTGTTTAEILGNAPSWSDVIIKNKDVRAVFSPTGEIAFLYSFLDKETLLIAERDETLRTLLPKVRAGRLR